MIDAVGDDSRTGRALKPRLDVPALVAFSFGKRADIEEPNPCNIAIAKAVRSLVGDDERGRPLVIAQWEVAKALSKLGIEVDHTVNELADHYLGSEEVWSSARQYLNARGVRDVIPVAQPFLQLRKVTQLMRSDGYHVHVVKLPRIGFDRSSHNRQWWTRGPVQLTLYALRQAIASFR